MGNDPSRTGRLVLLAAFLILAAAMPSAALAVDDVAGTLQVLTGSSTAPNGAWSWFQDERAIIDDSDPNNTLLLVGSVSSGDGDIDLSWLNVDTSAGGEFELHDQLQSDDHNSPALLIRPDGRYLAMYSTHIGGSVSYWRISTNPHDPTSWLPEQTFDNQANVTYSNLHYLPNDDGGAGRTYNFTRTINSDPNLLVSDDHGSTWSYGGTLVTYGDRPYVRYFSDGERIHFITTEGHPRDVDNSVYHGYVQDGVLYNSFGGVEDANLLDGIAVSPADLTPIFTTGTQFGGVPMTNAWTIDVAIDTAGQPVAVFTARANGSVDDHRYFYGTFDGSMWQVHEVAKAGGYLYSAGEGDYTGLVSIDPDSPDTLYMSTDVDPTTDQPLDHYEIFRGVTDDGGASWEWDPITWNSKLDNIRPLVPKWSDNETALVWMRGTYGSWLGSWDTQVVTLTFGPEGIPGDYNNNGVVDAADYTVWRDAMEVGASSLVNRGPYAGAVGEDDFVFWRDHFGDTPGAGSNEGVTAVVPEPAAILLAGQLLYVLAASSWYNRK